MRPQRKGTGLVKFYIDDDNSRRLVYDFTVLMELHELAVERKSSSRVVGLLEFGQQMLDEEIRTLVSAKSGKTVIDVVKVGDDDGKPYVLYREK